MKLMILNMMNLAVEFPEFFLPNCRLRRIQRNDVEAIFAGLSHPQVVAHYGVSYDSLEATDEQMRWYDTLLEEHRGIWWGVTLPGRDELIGACGFNDWSHSDRSLDIGYWLMPEHWGRGLMQDCLPTILRFALGPSAYTVSTQMLNLKTPPALVCWSGSASC